MPQATQGLHFAEGEREENSSLRLASPDLSSRDRLCTFGARRAKAVSRREIRCTACAPYSPCTEGAQAVHRISLVTEGDTQARRRRCTGGLCSPVHRISLVTEGDTQARRRRCTGGLCSPVHLLRRRRRKAVSRGTRRFSRRRNESDT